MTRINYSEWESKLSPDEFEQRYLARDEDDNGVEPLGCAALLMIVGTAVLWGMVFVRTAWPLITGVLGV